ncbi:MAG: hypothetical protein E5Y10_09300 [Mesorhizobium sp.]|uniref:hypothetical protein n=1 Tax=Mesorhizobium sp. TaxID=1871066 RepID=UPI0011FA82EF|nr:hypothetical protein [Mesorhizobium sp.]TIN40401.1 MAG: hypothetical protein E5Y13_11455 [Mesorhizobium sp.]TJU90631.1 MAG: hypothetical protein E5Y10_09300 [Mesorhizobium sp.]
MTAKLFDWSAEVQDAITRLSKPGLVFPFGKAATLVDYLASRMVVPRIDILKRAKEINVSDAENFLASTLANVTMAIHHKGTVPDPGGWYFHATEFDLNMYVLDRGFSAAWRAARS